MACMVQSYINIESPESMLLMMFNVMFHIARNQMLMFYCMFEFI